MLNYSNQPALQLFNNVTLTNSFDDNKRELQTAGFSKLSLSISYAFGAAETANTLDIQIEESPNGTDWFKLVIDNTATVSEISPRVWQAEPGNLNILLDIAYNNVRVSVKESGVATNYGTATIIAVPSGL